MAILFGTFGAEDRDRNRPTLRDIITLDARGHIVAQPDRFGALDKAAFRARFHQREAATALPQKIRSTRSVGQQRAGAGHEHEAWLMETGRGGPGPDADDIAQRARHLRGWKQ